MPAAREGTAGHGPWLASPSPARSRSPPSSASAAAHDVDVWPERLPPPPEACASSPPDADGLLCLLTDRVDAALLDAAPRLRVDLEPARWAPTTSTSTPRRVAGSRSASRPDVLTDATADLAFALLLAVRPPAARGRAPRCRAGEWVTWEPARLARPRASTGATLGIVGLGPHRPGGRPPRRGLRHGGARTPAADGLRSTRCSSAADFVSLHCPLTPETRHLIDAAALAAHAARPRYLVNTARGPIVDQDALARRAARRARSPAPRSTSPTPSRSRPTTRCSTRRTCSSSRTSARRPTPRASGWPTSRSRTCSPALAGEPMPHPANAVASRPHARRRRRHRDELHPPARRRRGADGLSRELDRRSIVTRLGEGVDATGALGDAPQRARLRGARGLRGGDRRAPAARRDRGADLARSATRRNGAAFAAVVRDRYGLDGAHAHRRRGGAADLPRARPRARDAGRHRRRCSSSTSAAARPSSSSARRATVDVPRLDAGRRRAPHRAPPALRPARRRTSCRRSPRTRAAIIEAAVPAEVRARGRPRRRRRRHGDAVRGDRPRARALRPDARRGPRADGRHASRCSSRRLAAVPLERAPRRSRGLHPARAPTIVAGVVILLEVLRAFDLDEVEVSERDILWGVALATAG